MKKSIIKEDKVRKERERRAIRREFQSLSKALELEPGEEFKELRERMKKMNLDVSKKVRSLR